MEQLQKLQYLSLVSKVTSGAHAGRGVRGQMPCSSPRSWVHW